MRFSTTTSSLHLANPAAWSWSPAGTCATPTPPKRSLDGVPRLWQKYIGHDDNRDFFASNQPETTTSTAFLSRVWYPQIVYNHHQAGPAAPSSHAALPRPNSNFYDPLRRARH